MNILKEICQKKIYEINKLKKTINYKNKIVISKRRDFLKKLIEEKKNKFNLIAEIKKSSPSKGEICKKFNLNQIAQDYENAGASCLSILTEKNYFQGDINYISRVKKIIDIPILRKDFILDEWQIYESYFFGADCILLILAILEDKEAKRFYDLSKELNLDVIVEVHDESELKRAIDLKVNCIGINNRNLKTLKIDLDTFKRLSKKIPNGIIKICESGLKSNKQLRDFTNMGADGFLIGEYLMSSENLKKETIEIIKK